MNIEKRRNYEKTMSLAGIDTLSGYIGKKITTKDMGNGIKRNINQFNYQTDKERTYLLINPNKEGVGENLITTYSEFVAKMNFILNSLDCNLEDLDVIRADFCFNSSDRDSYGEYQKLHRLIISCLAKAYKYENCYISSNMWDFARLSIAIKKDDSEIENYDKNRESHGKDESSNRLELRAKQMSGTSIEYQFMTKWMKRLDKAVTMFDQVQIEYNDHLEQKYKEDLKKSAKDRDFISLTVFLLYYKECIYTRRQMIDLLTRFDEVPNPTKRADKFKERHSIEYFSKTDLKHIVNVLKRKTEEYFKS